MPISGMTLPGVMCIPWFSRALRTSLVDSSDSFCFLLDSPIYFISYSILLRVKSAILPRRLKKLSSLHYSPLNSQIRLTRHSGIMLLVFDDSTRMEWISLSSSISSLPEYSNSGTASPCSLATCSYSSSQFQSIEATHQTIIYTFTHNPIKPIIPYHYDYFHKCICFSRI